MNSSALTAKLVLTGDNRGILTAAEGTVVALDQVKHKAQEAGAAAATASGEFNASAAAMRGQAEAATMANTAISAGADVRRAEVVRLTEAAAAGEVLTGRVRAMSAAHAEYNATVAQARMLLASQVITEAQYAEVLQAASAKLALVRVSTEATTAATVTELEAVQALSLGLRTLNLEASGSGMALDRLEANLAKIGRAGGISRGVISRTRGAIAAVPEFIEAFPVLSASAAIAAALGVVIAAEQFYEASTNHLDVAMQAHGLVLAGVSEKYLGLAHNIAEAAHVSERSGREMAGSFADAHLSPETWTKASAVARDYAAVLGTDVPVAAQKLGEGLAKPYEWAVQLTDQYGLFTQETLRNIQAQVESGHADAARMFILEAFGARIKNAADQTTFWAWSWGKVKEGVSDAFDALGRHLDWRTPQTMQPNDPNVEARNIQSRSMGQLADRYDPFSARLRENEAQQYAIVKASVDGAISAEEKQSLLDGNRRERTKIYKEQAEALRNLNDAEKQHYDRIKDLIAGAPQVIAQGKLDAETAVGRTEAYRHGTEALTAFNDQQEIAKATLPYMIELTYAHGTAAERLGKIIADVTAEKQKQLAADKELAAMQDIDQQIGSASGYMSNALADARLELNRKKLNDWYTATAATLAQSEEGWSQYHDKLDALFGKKLADLYDEDLRNRQDWASGIIRANNELVRSQQDWASKSEAFVKGWDRTSEDAFVNFAKTGKASFGDLTDFVIDQFARMAYQRYVAGAMNAIGGGILNAFDNVLGISGGGSIVSTKGQQPPGTSGIWGDLAAIVGIHHLGGEAGYPTVTRQVPVASFYDARVLHSGGFADDEVPAILKRRERVLTEEQQLQSGKAIDRWEQALSRPTVLQLPASAAASSAAPRIEQHFHEGPGVKIRKEESTTPDGGRRQDFFAEMMDEVESRLADKIDAGSSPVGSSMARRYGLENRIP